MADEPVRLVHAASGGDYEGAEASSQVTIVEDDVATLAVAGSRTTERAGRLTFDVTLSRASTAEVTVDYATGMVGDTAAAPVDYIVERGTLRFAAGSTSAQAIEVVVYDAGRAGRAAHGTATYVVHCIPSDFRRSEC